MTDVDSQLAEMPDLVQTLLDLSSEFVENSGNFLPHGAFQTDNGQIELVAAVGQHGITNSEEVLPILHDGLRHYTAAPATRIVAVSESVFIGPKRTPAIKVLVEHRDGLTVAFYQTWTKRFLRGIEFGDPAIREADPEVGGWAQVA